MIAEDKGVVSIVSWGFMGPTYVVEHLVARFETLRCEEFFEGFLFLAVWTR